MAKRGLVSKIAEFFRHVLPAIIRPIRVLWHEIIGFLFFVLALIAVRQGISAVREFDGQPKSVFRLAMVVLWFGIMLWFAVSSFWRARKISRS